MQSIIEHTDKNVKVGPRVLPKAHHFARAAISLIRHLLIKRRAQLIMKKMDSNECLTKGVNTTWVIRIQKTQTSPNDVVKEKRTKNQYMDRTTHPFIN